MRMISILTMSISVLFKKTTVKKTKFSDKKKHVYLIYPRSHKGIWGAVINGINHYFYKYSVT